jgi:hypothetical protein
MLKNRVIHQAMAGAVVTGALAFTATAQAETSPPSVDALSDCTMKVVFHSAAVTCKTGSGLVRAGVECELLNGDSKVVYGPWAGVNETSKANCHTLALLDGWYETA